MNDEERTQIDDWARKVSAALGHEGLEIDVESVLNLAGTAARVVVRPAAPLTTFIAGYAAGFSAATGANPTEAMREAIATADALGAGG